MATNFPNAYDDFSTLGGPFINEAPPVDPFRDIDAAHRNNLNDATFAAQSRIGYIGVADSATMDWALLTVGAAVNQGLRFAGDHANWPGAVGEDGLFINTATGNVSFHKSGDAVGVFTDLTAGATWDSIYTLDKDLLIDSGDLEFIVPNAATFYDFVFKNAGAQEFLRIDSSASTTILGSGAIAVQLAGAVSANISFDGSARQIDNTADIALLATGADITFQANGSAVIPVNSTTGGQTDLATTATNIVGAINELEAAVAASSLQTAYDGGQTISVNAADLILTMPSAATFYDFVVRDATPDEYIRADSSAKDLFLGKTTVVDTRVLGPLYAAQTLSVTGNAALLGAWSTSYHQTVDSPSDGFRFGLGSTNGAGNNNLILTTIGNRNNDHGHTPASSDPTLWVHSSLNPTTDDGEYAALSYTGLLGGTMETDRATYNLTVKASNAFASAVTNRTGGDLVLEGGSGTISSQDGIVQIGSSFATSHNLNSRNDLGITGDLEVNGDVYFDGINEFMDLTLVYADFQILSNNHLSMGDGDNARLIWDTAQTVDALRLEIQSASRTLIFHQRSSSGNFDHTLPADPTIFLHSALDPDTDNGEFLGLSYLGFTAGTMETDRATYDLTVKASNAFSGATTNVSGGDLVLEGGTGKTATDDGIVQIGSAFSTSHSLDSRNDLGIAGELEVNGATWFDGNVQLSNNIPLYLGSTANSSIRYTSGNGLVTGIPITRYWVMADELDITKDFGHAGQGNPTIFLHSALDPDTDDGEYVGITYQGMSGGTMETDRLTFAMTFKGANAFAAAVSNVLGGRLILEGGDGKTATDDGIVQVGATFSSVDGLDSKNDLGVKGDVEIQGTAFLNNADIDGTATFASDAIFNDSVSLYFGSSSDSGFVWDITQSIDTFLIDLSSASRSLVVYSDGYGDFDHALQPSPTIFVHSTLDPDTDNGEFVALSYLGLRAGTMETDRATYDMTIKSADAYASAVTNVTGGKLILEGGVGVGATDGGIVQIGQFFSTSHSLDAETDLGIAGELEVDGKTWLDGALDVTGAASFTNTVQISNDMTFLDDDDLIFGTGADANFQWSTAQTNHALIFGLGDTSKYLVIGDKADSAANFDHSNQGNPTVFVHSSLAPATDNGEYLGLSYLGLSGGSMETDRAAPQMTVKAISAYASATTNVSGGNLLLAPGDGTTDANDGTIFLLGSSRIQTTTTIAREALQIEQQDANEEFCYFNGTASDPSAGSAPADNLTEVNGSGAVVGPQTTSGSPDTGWAFYGMVKVRVDAVGGGTQDAWMAVYTPATS